MMVVARSCIFAAAQVLITPPFAVLALLTFPLPALTRYRIITTWSRIVIYLATHVCGIRVRVLGADNLPATPSVVLAKHQSAWETIAFQSILPPQVLVIKRELLWIPFFGWGLAMLAPIAIDRQSGVRSMKRMLRESKDRLARGFWIVVFPEGTRVQPGTRGTYQNGGAAMAVHAGVPIVPIAHNAGMAWGRNAFIKRPGLITVSIGPALPTAGRKAEALTREAETWIENEMARLGAAAAHS